MATSNYSLLLRHARVVHPDRVSEDSSVLIQNGRIVHVADPFKNEMPAGATEYDLQTLTLFPGFIDVHIHGAVGVDTMQANAADFDRISQFLATRGVTAWLPTLVPAPTADYQHAISGIAEAMKEQEQAGKHSSGTAPPGVRLLAARILGVHYEGPFVNSAQCGALHSQFFRSFSGAADLDDLPLIDQQPGKHMITVAPEIEGGVELVRELNRRGWIVSIGHTRAGFDLLDDAFEAGAHHMTHFMNAMPPLHHRSPGPVGWGLSHDNVTCDVIADGIHLDRRMLRLLLKLKGADRLSLISDAVAAAGMGDGEYEIWEETITVKGGRTSNSRGAIAGSVITMLDAVRLMQSLGVSEVDLAKMAASNPALLLGVDQECGSIEEGKQADLVALDDAGNVRLTIIDGCVAFRA
jgi:N-acetylglucosamine-6-phosphate deacetylase